MNNENATKPPIVGDPCNCVRCGAETRVGAAPRAMDCDGTPQCPSCWLKQSVRGKEAPSVP